MQKPEKYIDDILREEHEYLLPPGFAERVAAHAMSQSTLSVWDFLLRFAPQAGLACGVAVVLIAAFGFAGEGPGLVDSVTGFASLTELFPLQ